VREGVTERVNRGSGVVAGYDPEELVGKPSSFFFVDPEEGERMIAASRAALLRGEVYRGEFRIRHKDGSPGWARSVGRMVVPGDLSRGSVWITDDASALKVAEEKLHQSEIRYRTLFNANPQPSTTWA